MVMCVYYPLLQFFQRERGVKNVLTGRNGEEMS